MPERFISYHSAGVVNNNNNNISFMQGIYIYIPETNYVPRESSVAAILLLLFMVLISLLSVLNLLYFYTRTFRSIIIIIIIIIVPIILKYGSLNLLEPSGPVQAHNGIALPFT